MSAQTAATRKHTFAEPVTPVIIKSGGGNDGYESGGANPVEIHSPLVPFAESAPSPTWKTSRSTLAGRITQVTIKDGPDFITTNINRSDELVSIQIMYKEDQLTVSESGDAKNGFFLDVQSPEVAFNDPTESNWTHSKTTFPNPITWVTVMVGDNVDLSHQCQTADVTVHLSYDLT